MARTPSVEAHEKALDAALRLIEERGIEGTSMDAIAQLSGVSKATVYKHWKDKEALCIEVICSMRREQPEFRSGNSRQDLIDFLIYLSKWDKPDKLMKIWPRIIGYAAANPKFGLALQDCSFGPRRAQVSRILAEGAARGEMPAGIDPNFAMDFLVGPIMHRRFAGNVLSSEFPEQVVDTFLRGVSGTDGR